MVTMNDKNISNDNNNNNNNNKNNNKKKKKKNLLIITFTLLRHWIRSRGFKAMSLLYEHLYWDN